MNKNHKKNLWIVTVIAIGVIATTGIVFGILAANGIFNNNTTQKVTICTSRDYQGDYGPCTHEETVEIVATPDSPNDCPANTEPFYDVAGGIVGIKFVGCTQK